jgi:hypothetical protein
MLGPATPSSRSAVRAKSRDDQVAGIEKEAAKTRINYMTR